MGVSREEFTMYVQICLPAKKAKTSPMLQESITFLFAEMRRASPSIVILPLSSEETSMEDVLNPLTDGAAIPKDADKFSSTLPKEP